MLSFKGRHFPKTIILMAVRCYVAYALSYRDIEELMSERGVKLDHATVQRWVAEYSPELMEHARMVMKTSAGSWRMDETYIKVKGQWLYLYRVVDKFGNTIDFMLSKKRDRPAATRFFTQAIGHAGIADGTMYTHTRDATRFLAGQPLGRPIPVLAAAALQAWVAWATEHCVHARPGYEVQVAAKASWSAGEPIRLVTPAVETAAGDLLVYPRVLHRLLEHCELLAERQVFQCQLSA